MSSCHSPGCSALAFTADSNLKSAGTHRRQIAQLAHDLVVPVTAIQAEKIWKSLSTKMAGSACRSTKPSASSGSSVFSRDGAPGPTSPSVTLQETPFASCEPGWRHARHRVSARARALMLNSNNSRSLRTLAFPNGMTHGARRSLWRYTSCFPIIVPCWI